MKQLLNNIKKATDWFERLPTSDPKSLGIRHNKINLGKTYYPNIDFRTLTGEQIEKIWFEETGGDGCYTTDTKIIEWWGTIPNAKYGTPDDPKPNRTQLLCKYFEDGMTRAITLETLRYIYEKEHDQVLDKKDFNNKLSKLVVEPSKKGIKLQKRLERMDSYHDKVFEIALLLIDKIKESGDTKRTAAEKLMITKKRLKKILKSRANLKISEIVQIEKVYQIAVLNNVNNFLL